MDNLIKYIKDIIDQDPFLGKTIEGEIIIENRGEEGYLEYYPINLNDYLLDTLLIEANEKGIVTISCDNVTKFSVSKDYFSKKLLNIDTIFDIIDFIFENKYKLKDSPEFKVYNIENSIEIYIPERGSIFIYYSPNGEVYKCSLICQSFNVKLDRNKNDCDIFVYKGILIARTDRLDINKTKSFESTLIDIIKKDLKQLSFDAVFDTLIRLYAYKEIRMLLDDSLKIIEKKINEDSEE